ncbi:MAG: glycosyltransferase family 2 protein [Patescibacteria group bacterium]|jgi:hypothetical protein
MNGIGIIVVTWNSRATIEHCLASIPTALASGEAVSVVVVDNNSNDGTREWLSGQSQLTKVILNDENFGFARACNKGAKALKECEYLIFLNPDTVLHAHALDELITFFKEQPFAGILGPKIVNADGSLQPSVRTFPSVTSMVLNLLKIEYFFPRLLSLRRYMMTSFSYATLREVDQVMGACFAVRRSVFETLGGFDEKFFIWFEEVDFCRRAMSEGWLIFFVPWAVITHERAASFKQKNQLWRQWFFSKSARRYFRKHHSFLSALVVAVASYIVLIPAAVLSVFSSRFRP